MSAEGAANRDHLEDWGGPSEAATRWPHSSRNPPPAFLSLTPWDVHVWLVSLDSPAQLEYGLEDILSEDERARAGRFVFERDRRRFIVCRGMLRTILARYMRVAPADLEFRYSAYGKPAVITDAGGHALRFNVSHAEGMAVYAITLGREIGIDLEHVRSDFATDEIAEQFFSANEVAMSVSAACNNDDAPHGDNNHDSPNEPHGKTC